MRLFFNHHLCDIYMFSCATKALSTLGDLSAIYKIIDTTL